MPFDAAKHFSSARYSSHHRNERQQLSSMSAVKKTNPKPVYRIMSPYVAARVYTEFCSCMPHEPRL